MIEISSFSWNTVKAIDVVATQIHQDTDWNTERKVEICVGCVWENVASALHFLAGAMFWQPAKQKSM